MREIATSCYSLTTALYSALVLLASIDNVILVATVVQHPRLDEPQVFLPYCNPIVYIKSVGTLGVCIVFPLHRLTGKDARFQWGHEQQVAFGDLNKRLLTPPILAFPNYDWKFVVYTDTSMQALGLVLAKVGEDGLEHPLQYASRVLDATERSYSTFEREALEVIFALKKFRHYHLSGPFDVFSGHQALRSAFSKRDVHGRMSRWLNTFVEFEM